MSRGLGDVYKRQPRMSPSELGTTTAWLAATAESKAKPSSNRTEFLGIGGYCDRDLDPEGLTVAHLSSATHTRPAWEYQGWQPPGMQKTADQYTPSSFPGSSRLTLVASLFPSLGGGPELGWGAL